MSPTSAYFTLKLPLSSPQVLLYFLVATSSPPVTSAGIPSDGLHMYVRAWEHRGVPKASSDVASLSSGNHGSLSVGHYELCRDDIGDLPGSPEHL